MIGKDIIYTRETEQILLRQAAAGSREAYAALYRYFLPKLYQYTYNIVRSKEDTKELLQDIFLKLWEKKEDLEKVSSLNSYLFRMAHNKLMNLFDHQKVRQKAMDYIGMHAVETGSTLEDEYIYNEYSETARRAVNSLPPKRRQVFELSNMHDLSYDEIAAELQISKSMVKKQLYSANRQIKDYLDLDAGVKVTIAITAGIIITTMR